MISTTRDSRKKQLKESLKELFRKLFGKQEKYAFLRETADARTVETSQETLVERELKRILCLLNPTTQLRGSETSSTLLEHLGSIYPSLVPALKQVLQRTLLRLLQNTEVSPPEWIRIIQFLGKKSKDLADEELDALQREVKSIKNRPERRKKIRDLAKAVGMLKKKKAERKKKKGKK